LFEKCIFLKEGVEKRGYDNTEPNAEASKEKLSNLFYPVGFRHALEMSTTSAQLFIIQLTSGCYVFFKYFFFLLINENSVKWNDIESAVFL
jgi:hypothetical protein